MKGDLVQGVGVTYRKDSAPRAVFRTSRCRKVDKLWGGCLRLAMVRGTRFVPLGELPTAAFEIPGVWRTKKTGYVTVPPHAMDLVSRLAPGVGFRPKLPRGPECLIPVGADPFAAHPRISDEARDLATKYQREDLAFFLRSWGGIADWPCGSGKTLLGLAFASAWQDVRALVVTRSVVTTQWVAEARRWLSPSVSAFAIRSFSVEVVEEKLPRRVRLAKRDELRSLVLKGKAPASLLYVLHEDAWVAWERLTEEEREALGRQAPRRCVEVEIPTTRVIDAGGTKIEAESEDALREGLPPVDIIAIGWETLTANVEAINAWGPAIVVFDELHRGKNHQRRSRIARSDGSEEWVRKKNVSASAEWLAQNAPVVLGLTATPQYNRVKDWWGQLDLIDPFGFGTYRQFAFRYCDAKEGKYKLEADGVSHVAEFKERLSHVIRTRTKAETHAQLPPLVRNLIWVPFQNADQLDPDAFASIKGSVSGEAFQVAIASVQKRSTLIQTVLGYLAEGAKVVVLTLLRSSARAIFEAFQGAAPEGCLVLYGDGGVSQDERRKAVGDLVAHNGGGALVGTIASFGESIDGMQHFDRAALDSVPLTPGELIQLEGRFTRLGGKKSIVLDWFLMTGSVDDRYLWLVSGKLEQLQQVRPDADIDALTGAMSGDDKREESLLAMAKLLEAFELEVDIEDDEENPLARMRAAAEER